VVIGDSRPLTWAEYEAVVYDGAAVALSPANRIAEHRGELQRQIDAGAVVYSVNTGYGADAHRQLAPESIGQIQIDTLRSHAVGTGPDAPVPVVRGQMLLKAQAYAQGPAGLRSEVVEQLVWFLNHGVTPRVPLYGSQSASGDLIPNAHLGLALMGEGDVLVDGRRQPADELPKPAFVPQMKEGVALTNDCSYATAFAFDVVRDGLSLVDDVEGIAAVSLQALRGHPDAFDQRLVGLRPHPGALESARHMRALLEHSELLRDPGRPHDPYSLRCIPQVHGAVRDALRYAHAAIEVELRSIGDNPVVVLADGTTLSGGNIHGEPIAIPMDTVAIALTELAALSQARTLHLVACRFDVGLPPKLSPAARNGFGLSMLNTTASALVSEMRSLLGAASAESIGVDHMEDHVSMAAVAARKAGMVLGLARRVAAVELACAAQALEFQGVGNASAAAQELHARVRERLAFVDADTPVDVDSLLELLCR
jgi:histidine ammonia-lyase